MNREEIALDIRSLSQSTRDGRCLEVWFVKNVTDEDRGNLLKAVNLLRAIPAQGEPVAWACSDDRFPYLKGIVTDRKATVDAWREGCIKFDALVRAALPSSPAISPADLAEVLENVRKAIENLSDFRSVKNVPIELHKACHALTHIVALLKP